MMAVRRARLWCKATYLVRHVALHDVELGEKLFLAGGLSGKAAAAGASGLGSAGRGSGDDGRHLHARANKRIRGVNSGTMRHSEKVSINWMTNMVLLLIKYARTIHFADISSVNRQRFFSTLV